MSSALFEIEYQRMFRLQGQVLRCIYRRQQQYECYMSKVREYERAGLIVPETLCQRIDLTQERLCRYNEMRDLIEDYKDEISVNNPQNADLAAESSIVNAAYELAYFADMTGQGGGGAIARLLKNMWQRQK